MAQTISSTKIEFRQAAKICKITVFSVAFPICDFGSSVCLLYKNVL